MIPEKNLLFVVLTLVAGILQAQTITDKVLMTCDGSPVYATEFKEVYLKNIELVETTSEKGLDTYLDLFKKYKLKIKEARRLGYHERENLKQELEVYSDQLADSFMSDGSITEELIREAYDRMVNEVKASHIMIGLKSNEPEDTLIAYYRIDSIRGRLLRGADFAIVAKDESEDPSASINNGDLGWFRAFDMVYPFEEAAFETPVGEISPVIRTRYGYHLVKPIQKRKSAGTVEVRHILIEEYDTAESAKQKISEIYKRLQEGVSFETLASDYSDDTASAEAGGRLSPFRAGTYQSEIFEQNAFQLEIPDQISEPFRTEFGWHILKLISRSPVLSLQELRPVLEQKIRKDSRGQLADQALYAKIEEIFPVWENKDLVGDFKSFYNSNSRHFVVVKEKEEFPALKIAQQSFSYFEFANFLNENSINSGTDLDLYLKNFFKIYKEENLKAYYKSHLEEINPEYARIIKEYRDGIILFALMEDKIWSKAREDIAGLQGFFSRNRNRYPSSSDLAEIKGRVITDYQYYLENLFIKELETRFEIKVNNEVFESLKKELSR